MTITKLPVESFAYELWVLHTEWKPTNGPKSWLGKARVNQHEGGITPKEEYLNSSEAAAVSSDYLAH